MNIGTAIRTVRKEQQISQGILAEMIGLSQSSLSLIESGESIPSPKSLAAICRVLRVSPALLYMLGIEESDVPEERRAIYTALGSTFKALAMQLLGPEQGELLEKRM